MALQRLRFNINCPWIFLKEGLEKKISLSQGGDMVDITLLEGGNGEFPLCLIPFDSMEDILGALHVVKSFPPKLLFASVDSLLESLAGLLPFLWGGG